MHQEVIKNLESIHGALLRMNRSIQADGTFVIMKNDRWYKRIVRRGIHSVKLEVLLVAIGHNLYKYQKKRWETELPHRFKKEFLWGRGRALSLRIISVIYTQQVQKWRCEKTQSSFFTSPITTMGQLICGRMVWLKRGAASWMKGDVARNYTQWNKRGSAGIAIEVGNKINRHARICTKTRFRGLLKTGSSELAMELFFWLFYKSDVLLRAWQILR